jgi:murein tripeptide amidase MpaA
MKYHFKTFTYTITAIQFGSCFRRYFTLKHDFSILKDNELVQSSYVIFIGILHASLLLQYWNNVQQREGYVLASRLAVINQTLASRLRTALSIFRLGKKQPRNCYTWGTAVYVRDGLGITALGFTHNTYRTPNTVQAHNTILCYWIVALSFPWLFYIRL